MHVREDRVFNGDGAATAATSELERAVQAAITSSTKVADDLDERLTGAFNTLETTARRVSETLGSDAIAKQTVRTFAVTVNEVRRDAESLFKRQKKALQTVNIALFGRTGSGKSSLIEALTGGDGLTR